MAFTIGEGQERGEEVWGWVGGGGVKPLVLSGGAPAEPAKGQGLRKHSVAMIVRH